MAKTEVEDKPKEEKKKDVEAVEVPTQMGLAYRLPNGDIVGTEQYLAWLGNMVYHIRKNTG
jgi:hypothetical protein